MCENRASQKGTSGAAETVKSAKNSAAAVPLSKTMYTGDRPPTGDLQRSVPGPVRKEPSIPSVALIPGYEMPGWTGMHNIVGIPAHTGLGPGREHCLCGLNWRARRRDAGMCSMTRPPSVLCEAHQRQQHPQRLIFFLQHCHTRAFVAACLRLRCRAWGTPSHDVELSEA